MTRKTSLRAMSTHYKARVTSRCVGYAVSAAMLIVLLMTGCAEQKQHGHLSMVETQPPNIIWIVLDACRAANLSCYSYERETTPNLSQLAARGALFEQHYSQARYTTLSVPSYFTGQYFPVYCFERGPWRAMYRQRPTDEQYITEILRSNGYRTAGISPHPWFTSGSRIVQSFDEFQFIPPPNPNVYARFAEVNARVFEWLSVAPDTPFFLYVHVLDAHQPRVTTGRFRTWIDTRYEQARREDPSLCDPPFNEREQHHLQALYDGAVSYADHHVGELLATLDERGLTDTTILVVSSDHGELLGEDGESFGHPPGKLSDELFHVPLLLAGPGIRANVRTSALTENVDIVPTLVDLVSARTEARMNGRSLVPLMQDPSQQGMRKYVVAREDKHFDDGPPILMARDRDFHFEAAFPAGLAFLWQRPDRVTRRVDCAEEMPEKAQAMRSFLEREIFPLWEAYGKLPHTERTAFRVAIPADAGPLDAWAYPSSPTDNKWELTLGRALSCAFREDAPPITFRLDAPPGTFRVQIEAETCTRCEEREGSILAVKAQADTEYIILEALDTSRPAQFLDLGVYTIADSGFELTLDEGSTTHWAAVYAVRFIPVDAGPEQETAIEDHERDEQLRALGYLGG